MMLDDKFESPAELSQNVDSSFGLNLFNMDVPAQELKLKITVKTKAAENGQSGKVCFENVIILCSS